MTLNKLLSYINYQLNITKSGNQLNPPEYNNLLEAQYLAYFRIKIKEYRQRQRDNDGNLSMLFYDMLTSLSTKGDVTITTGAGAMPATYGAWNEAYGTYDGISKRIELITEEERVRRNNDMMSRPFEYFPACVVRGETLTVYPNNITPVTLIFYTKPLQPVFDYYIDADGKVVYMTEGQTGVSVPTGGRTSAGVSGPVTINSNTIELDFPDDMHEDFANYLLSIIGVKIDMNITQIAEAKKQTL